MKTKVLVTGASGQLARTIKAAYANDDAIEFCFTAKDQLDITDQEDLMAYFKQDNYQYCINCAAYTNVEQAESTPEAAFMVNAEAVKYLAKACKNTGVVLIHISTDYVFDGNKKTPYKENDTTNPINQYGASKLKGEGYIEQIMTKYFIVRTSWLYSKFGHNFLKSMIGKIQAHDQLNITTSQIGTPTSCSDLSEFIVKLIKDNCTKYGIYHFSAMGETTWYGYALQIAKHFSKYDSKKIKPVQLFQTKASRPGYSVLDNGKAKGVFDKEIFWENSVDLTVKELLK